MGDARLRLVWREGCGVLVIVIHSEDTMVRDVADAYGIRLVEVENDAVPLPPEQCGPYGHGCDPATRTVYIETDSWRVDAHDVEVYFHEVVHAIVQPPFWTMEATAEEYVLFQFERALARAVLPTWAYLRVVDWQMQTGLGGENKNKTFGDFPQYKRSSLWRRGFARCRAVGLLDERNRPTGRMPDWSKLPPHLVDEPMAGMKFPYSLASAA